MWWALAAVAALKLMQGFIGFRQERAAGQMAKEAGKYQNTLAMRRATAMDMRASEERAASQRRMAEHRRQAAFVSGRAKTLAAAGGIGLDSPGIANILGDIEVEAAYRSDMEKYRGEEAGRGLEYQAQMERAQGQAARYRGQVEDRLAKQRAVQSLLGGAIGAASAGAGAYQAYSASATPQMEMGGFQTQTSAQMAVNQNQYSPLYAKYGQGGYSQSVYP